MKEIDTGMQIVLLGSCKNFLDCLQAMKNKYTYYRMQYSTIQLALNKSVRSLFSHPPPFILATIIVSKRYKKCPKKTINNFISIFQNFIEKIYMHMIEQFQP